MNGDIMILLGCKKRFFSTLLGVSLLLAPAAHAANVVFDLGGVVLNSSYFSMFRQTGMVKMLAYLVVKGQNPRHLLFSVMDSIDLPGELTPEQEKACDLQNEQGVSSGGYRGTIYSTLRPLSSLRNRCISGYTYPTL